MADPQSAATSVEKTFRKYTEEQGATYAQQRPTYHPNLIKRIVDYHVSGGGQLGLAVDVGCGPGTATEAIAPFFAQTIGLDPSEGMIATAKARSQASENASSVRYELSSGEELGSNTNLISNGSVDLITAATAAHWFDMNTFWPRAAEVLRPGGTVALWVVNFNEHHPSTPNADKINAAIAEIYERELNRFMEPGNILVQKLYEGMPLPWMITPSPVSDFDQASFFSKYWGVPDEDDAEAEGAELYLNGQRQYTLDMMEAGISTASPITRWRQANPDKVGTDQDVVKQMRIAIERLLHEAGVEEGKELIRGKVSGVLWMLKKKQ